MMILHSCILLIFAVTGLCQYDGANSAYTNPILTGNGADPWVIKHEDYYYMTFTLATNITIYRSKILTDWNNAEERMVFNATPNTPYAYSLWAPELHHIGDRWQIIFTANSDNEAPSPMQDMLCTYSCPAVNHRMFTLSSDSDDPWDTNYSLQGMLDTYDQFAIDGTYFSPTTGSHAGELYHVYSCWYNNFTSWPSMLCISEMSDPYTIASNLSQRAIISKPDEPWEKTPYNRTLNERLASNEGPEQLTNPSTNQTFVIHSAARSDNANYCLGQLELLGDDPLAVSSWKKHTGGCVFEAAPENQAYGVGHASFTTSPDGTEDWIVYHGMRDPVEGWADRTIRTQPFTWNEDGSPKFPAPGYGPYPVPAG